MGLARCTGRCHGLQVGNWNGCRCIDRAAANAARACGSAECEQALDEHRGTTTPIRPIGHWQASAQPASPVNSGLYHDAAFLHGFCQMGQGGAIRRTDPPVRPRSAAAWAVLHRRFPPSIVAWSGRPMPQCPSARRSLRRITAAARHVGHVRIIGSHRGQSRGRLHTHQSPDCLAEQGGLVHGRIGRIQCLLVERVVTRHSVGMATCSPHSIRRLAA